MAYSGFHGAVRALHNGVKERWPINLVNLVDLTEVELFRDRYDANNKPSYTACIVKAIAMGVAELSPKYPELNSMIGSFCGFRWIKEFDHITAGVAVSREYEYQDIAFPQVIQHPQNQSVAMISHNLHSAAVDPPYPGTDYDNCLRLYSKPYWLQKLMVYIGLNNRKHHSLTRGTFSLTTVGKFGVDIQASMPLTTPIQWGFGKVKLRPMVIGTKIKAVQSAYITLAFDRRLLNGKPCAALMDYVVDVLTHATERL